LNWYLPLLRCILEEETFSAAAADDDDVSGQWQVDEGLSYLKAITMQVNWTM
jgi:hypothetical protein